MATDVYERITARIVDQLERGTVPWRKPWQGGQSGHPRNLVSGRRYRGINTFLLSCSPFESPFWLTFKQAKALGGHVRKGEESTPLIFWRWLDRTDAETGESKRFPLLRQYRAFNSEQCELPPDRIPDVAAAPENNFSPIEVCEHVVADMPHPPGIRHGGGAAFYRPATDTVQMPQPERFDESEDYYSTLFHELVHSTGHESRLGRPGITEEIRFGNHSYSREELIAEMGAAFLCGHCGIENCVIDNSAAYLASWLTRLRDDKRLVVHAAAAAQKAADFILSQQFDPDTDHETVGPTTSSSSNCL